jgi:hypothetical protein
MTLQTDDAVAQSPSKPKRRWLQYSLSTLLGVVTLTAAFLGLVVHRAERQRKVVAVIEALGGYVEYEGDQVQGDEIEVHESRCVRFFRDRLPQDYVEHVIYVDLSDRKATDATLFMLGGLSELKEVRLDRTKVTDAGMAHLSRLVQLEFLSLNDTRISESALARLAGLTKLQSLWLNGTQVRETGLAHLRGLPQLSELSLENAPVTDTGLSYLRGLTALQLLLVRNSHVTAAGAAELQEALPYCEVVHGQVDRLNY